MPTMVLTLSIGLFLMFSLSVAHTSSGDTIRCQEGWWSFIHEHGWSSISKLNYNTAAGKACPGDYTTIWYFLIYLFTSIGIYPSFSLVACIKIMTLIGILASAIAVFFITKHFRPHSIWMPTIFSALTLFLPVFLGDLIKANLPDSVHISLSLLAFLAILKKRNNLAWFTIGVALSFKLMAVYIVPVFILLYILDFKKSSLKDKLAPLFILFGVLVCSLPNFFAGGSLFEGILGPILFRSGLGSTVIPTSNIWSLLPNYLPAFKFASVAVLLFIFLLIFIIIIYFVPKKQQKQITIALLPSLSILLCFFFLPKQHELYMQMAGIFSLLGIAAMRNQKMLFIFVMISIITFLNMQLTLALGFLPAEARATPLSVQAISLATLTVIIYICLYLLSLSEIIEFNSKEDNRKK